MPNLPDTLHILLSRFAEISLSVVLKFKLLSQLDLVGLSRFFPPKKNFLNYLIIVIYCVKTFDTVKVFGYNPSVMA